MSTSGPWTLAELERTHPWIPWREPQQVRVMGYPTEHYICRVCVANGGLKEANVAALPTSPAEIIEHMVREHL